MDSLILTLDPALPGGVVAMRDEMLAAHERLGLRPHLGYIRIDRLSRFDLRERSETRARRQAFSWGYLPSIEYLNYLAAGIVGRRTLASFDIVQVVSGSHAASMAPIVAGVPFASWIATPFGEENESRYAAPAPGVSVRINYRFRGANDAIERWSLRFPRAVFALSGHTAGRLAHLTRTPRTRFEVLRCPVDTTLFNPQGPRWDRAPRGPYVISAGRVDDERKNFASLLRSFAAVAGDFPELRLVIAGEVKDSSPMKRLAGTLGIASRVMFPGGLAREELAQAYRGASAFAFTSRQEGLGIVILEAQASGLPVAIMRCGGGDELVDHGRTGMLVDQGDERGLSGALSRLMSDPHRARTMGMDGRDEVKVSASRAAFDSRLREVYARLGIN